MSRNACALLLGRAALWDKSRYLLVGVVAVTSERNDIYVCREKAELKRTQLQERIAAGEQVRERVPAVAVPDDEDVEWQQLVAANRDAGCSSPSLLASVSPHAAPGFCPCLRPFTSQCCGFLWKRGRRA